MSMFKEFKDFAMKGNLVDMAVAFVMGAAFTKLVTGFINGIVMPIVGQVTAGIDFNDLKIVLKEAQIDATGVITNPEVAILYGTFISIIIDFILVALFMFLIVKNMNKMKKKAADDAVTPTPEPSEEQKLLTEIRDLLKNQK